MAVLGKTYVRQWTSFGCYEDLKDITILENPTELN